MTLNAREAVAVLGEDTSIGVVGVINIRQQAKRLSDFFEHCGVDCVWANTCADYNGAAFNAMVAIPLDLNTCGFDLNAV
ncbi:hypothetical protein CLV88_10533 [Shimia abyssi]|uniref:Uncharacterized protein n=1 Tax=Shimia abyssi TaxID=1662395 RepID=A0A2P8FD13_9RHOB|nr:hypothetical protein CLV88_10533 [Shimia abyssi]